MFLKCIIQREVAARTGDVAWLGPIRDGAREGEEEKIFLTGVESWEELLLPSWPKKLVFEIVLYSAEGETGVWGVVPPDV
jgi:hypothetical protein